MINDLSPTDFSDELDASNQPALPTPEGGDVPAQSDAPRYEGWVSVFESGTDFEADLVRDRLGEQDISAVVFTQRDHVFNLNVGDLALVHELVPPDPEAAARAVDAEAPATDAELEEAAMSADPYAPDAYDPSTEASLDSGMESLDFSIPAESGDEGTANSDRADDDLRDEAGGVDPHVL